MRMLEEKYCISGLLIILLFSFLLAAEDSVSGGVDKKSKTCLIL